MQLTVTIILSCRFPTPCRQGIENAGACHFSKASLFLICFSHADRKPLRFSTMGGWLSFHLPAVFDTIWFYFRSIRKSKDFKYKARCSFSLNRLFLLPMPQWKPLQLTSHYNGKYHCRLSPEYTGRVNKLPFL